MILRRKAAKGIVWSAIQIWGRQAITFVVFVLLSRLLGPKSFGLVATAGIFLSFIEVFIDQGFSTAIIQIKKAEPEHLDTAFWTTILLGCFMTGFGILVADSVASFFQQPDLTPIVRWLSLSFVILAFVKVQEAVLKRELNFKPLAVRSLMATAIGGIVGVTMALNGFGVWSLVGQQLTSAVIGVLVLWSVSTWRPRFRVSLIHFKELFSFGINIFAVNILEFFNRRSDDFLIGYFLGPVALGYYTVAYRIFLLLTQSLISITSQVALSGFSRLQEEPEELRQSFYKAIQLSSLLAFPIFSVMGALAPEIVQMAFGEKWLPSVPVMQILALTGILHSVSFFDSNVIVAKGKPSWRLYLNCLNAVSNVIGFLIAVRWGIVAVAASYAIQNYVFSPLSLWAVHKLITIRIKTYVRQLWTPTIGSLSVVFSILALKALVSNDMSTFFVLVCSVVLGTLVYLSVIRVSSPEIFLSASLLVKSRFNIILGRQS